MPGKGGPPSKIPLGDFVRGSSDRCACAIFATLAFQYVYCTQFSCVSMSTGGRALLWERASSTLPDTESMTRMVIMRTDLRMPVEEVAVTLWLVATTNRCGFRYLSSNESSPSTRAGSGCGSSEQQAAKKQVRV